jgi:hypothetical protein
MPAWSSHNANPPSLLYPPEGQKWHARAGLAGTSGASGVNGKAVAIIELRGWLRVVDGGCNDVDPDWHYDLELDPAWLDALGLAAEALLLPGDVILEEGVSAGVQSEVVARSSTRARYSEPIVHIELDGWPRKDADRGTPAKPSTWTFTNDCSGATWPYDPRQPGGTALAPGQYVRVVGSLVTDTPHMMSDQIATNYVLRFGYAAAVRDLGQQRADGGQTNAVKWMWGGNRGENDPTHPARWNEIHSPDYFEVFAAKDRPETVRCVALVAQDGLTSGDVEEFTAEIRPPARPTRWYVVGCRKALGPHSAPSTVEADEVIVSADRVRVHARVRGRAQLGGAGKFHAIYRVAWRPVAPALHAATSVDGTAMLGAVDGDAKTMSRPGAASAPFWPAAWFEVQSGRARPGAHLTAVSRASACFDAFVVGTDGRVYTAATQGAAWGGWWPIPGVTLPQGAPIGPVSRSTSKLDIFCADTSGRIMSAAWEPGFAQWAGWWWIRGGVTAPGGAVTAVSRRSDYLDIFTIGTDGRPYTAAWAPGPAGWQGWWPIGGAMASPGAPIACISRSQDTLDLFAADTQGRVMTANWSPTQAGWQGWTQVQGGVTGAGAPLAVASRRPDFLDVFVVGTDGRIYTAAWEPGPGWRGWWALPGLTSPPGTSIAALSPAQDVLLVVTSGGDGRIAANAWTPATAWQGWTIID